MLPRIHLVTWTLLLLFFVIHTVAKFCIDLERERIRIPSQASSMDRMLGRLLQIAHPAETLKNTLAELPDSCSLVTVYPRDSEDYDFVRCAIGYLSWPRKINGVKLTLGENSGAFVSEYTAFLFCGLPAPELPNARLVRTGPNVVLLSASKSR